MRYSQGLSFGASIDTGEITDGAVTFAKLGTDLYKAELLETFSLSSDSTVTTGTLDVFKQYLVIADLYGLTDTAQLIGNVNGISTASYNALVSNNGSISVNNGRTTYLMSSGNSTNRAVIQALFGGISAPIASGKISIISQGGVPSSIVGFVNELTLGNAVQVSNITFSVNTGTMTGTIKVYGVA